MFQVAKLDSSHNHRLSKSTPQQHKTKLIKHFHFSDIPPSFLQCSQQIFLYIYICLGASLFWRASIQAHQSHALICPISSQIEYHNEWASGASFIHNRYHCCEFLSLSGNDRAGYFNFGSMSELPENVDCKSLHLMKHPQT